MPGGRKPAISPDKLLELMKNPEEPDTLGAILEETKLSSGSVTYWRKNIDGYDLRYRDALAIMKRKKAEAANKLKHRAKVGDDWKQLWLDVFRSTGSWRRACSASGIHSATVGKRIDPSDNQYDKTFHALYTEAEASLSRTLEDVAHERAIAEKSDGMIKFLLSTRMPEKYGKTVTHEVSGTVRHEVVEGNAAKFLKSIFGEDVIEGELVGAASQEQKRLPANVRDDEGLASGRCDGGEAVLVQERPFLSSSI